MTRRVALVTGAARGIGAATVRRLADEGWRVVAMDSCEGSTATAPYPLATLDDLKSVGRMDGVVTHVADVRRPFEIAAAVDLAFECWDRLDAVVAAAAVIVGGQPVWEMDEQDLDLLLEVDVKGVWNTAVATVPALLSGPEPSSARFVAIASAAAEHGLAKLTGYGMAKHAVVGLMRGLAADLAGTGVTACAVSPGSTRTPMLAVSADLYRLDDVEEFASNQLLRRLLDPDEVAATVAFCCSRDAALLNGSVVQADGGFSP